MRSFNQIFVSLILSALLADPVSSFSQTPQAPPDTVVRDFYAWYLHKEYGENLTKQKATALKYVTPAFYASLPKLERLEYDAFVCAQDWDSQWQRSFKVAEPTINGRVATTLVNLPSGDAGIRIRVTLKRTSAGWRINKLACVHSKNVVYM